MADGSVTIKVDMDSSDAKSGVSKLKALFGGLESASSKAGSVFKSVLGANLISSALTSGISTITGGIRDMASELNGSQKAWKTFEGNLQAFGRSTDEIKAAKAEMQDFATKTIYSASDMASTYSQLDAVGTKNVGSLVKAFGGLAASAENPAQAMKSLSTQATQMASKPKVAWMDFKIMMEQAPAGMAAVAKEMGMSTAELVSAVQDGKIKTEDFFDAMNRAGNSDAFQKMATEFKTVDQAIDGAKESLANKLMPVFEKLNSFGIKAVNALSDALGKINFDKMAEGLGKFFDGINIEAIISNVSNAISNVVSKIKTFWSAFANTGAVSAFAGAIKSIAGALGHVWESLTASNVLTTLGNALGTVVKWLSQAATMAANFVSSLPTGVIQAIAGGLVGLIAGFKALNFLQSFNPFGIFKGNAESALDGATNSAKRSKSVITQVFNGLSNVIKSAGTAIKAAAIGIGQGLGAALKGIGQGLAKVNPVTIAALAVPILALGAAMALAGMQGAGIAKILQGIGGVVESVGQAFATIASSIIDAFAKALVTIAPAVQAFVPVIHAIGEAIGTVVVAVGLVAPQLAILVNAFGTAFSSIIQAVGTAVQSIASGIAQIVTAFAPIVETIGNTIVQVTQIIMTNLPPVLEAVAPIIETLGNVFTTTAQIIANAIVQIVQALVPVMPAVAQVASAIGSAVSSIAEAFASVVGQIAPIIDSLSNLFTSVGSAIQSALTPVAPIIEAFGNSVKSVFEGAADVIRAFGDAVKSILDGVSGVIKSIGEAIKDAGQGFKLFGEGVKLAGDHGLAAAGGIAAVAGAVLGLGTASAGGNLNGFREDLDKLDTVMYKISGRNVGSVFSQMGSGMQTAASMVTRLTAGLPLVATAMQQLGPASTASASGVRSFAQGFSSLGSSLSGAVPMFTRMTSSFTQFNAGMTTATSGLTMFGSVLSSIQGVLSSVVASLTSFLATSTAVNASVRSMQASFMSLGSSLATSGTMFGQLGAVMTAAMAQVASAATSGMSRVQSVIRSSMMQAVASVTSSMMQIVMVVRMSAVQMTQAGQQAGRGVTNGITNGIRSGIGSATAAMSAMIHAIRSTAAAGAGMMVGIGAMIGQGLAQGMYSALGAVTAAANALVAQAERAAQAKAKIHSPSRLFRDNVGRYIAQGIAVGIEQNASDVTDSLAYVQREMSAFKFGVEDLLGLGTSTLSSQFKLKSRIERAETSQIEVIREQSDKALTRALEVAEEAVKRPVNLMLDDGALVAKIGQPMTNFQNDKLMLDNMMRGII